MRKIGSKKKIDGVESDDPLNAEENVSDHEQLDSDEEVLAAKTPPKKKKPSTPKNVENDAEQNHEESSNGTPLSEDKSKGKKRKADIIETSKDKNGEDDDEKSEKNGDDDGAEPEEEEYEIKAIVDHKVEKGVSYYLIRWKGFGADDDTWEREDSLSCQDLIEKFNSKKGKKSESGGKKKGKKATESKTSEANGDDEEEYEVQTLIDHKVERGVSYYLVRWKGYSASDDSWEREDSLSCQDLIKKFNKKGGVKSTASNKKNVKAKEPAAKKKKKEIAVDPSKEWEVDKIVDYHDDKKQGRLFRIRWKGFKSSDDTWEPEKNLNCKDLIEKFLKKADAEKDVTVKVLREEPKSTKRLVNETERSRGARKSKRASRGQQRTTYYEDSD